MNDTKLIFVLGSGRCGTKAIVKMLAGTSNLEAHHEYCRYAYQREAVLYNVQLVDSSLMKDRLASIYTSAAYYSNASQFLDSSHKLVPVADLLVEMYPDAKFIHLVRDGRKVAASFYYKLSHICHEQGYQQLRQFIKNPGRHPVPPPSEKFWFIPPPHDMDRMGRIAWMWAMYNTLIEEALVKADQNYFVRLEDITSEKDTLKGLIDFIGVEWSDTYWQALQKPDHAYVPVNYRMTEEQTKQFETIAQPMMDYYGYTGKEKDVEYYKV